MTDPTFRPIADDAFSGGTALSAEHGRRIVRDTLAGLNQRPMQVGSPFRRYAGDGTELQTLWRWCINWGHIGPWRFYSPRSGKVRILLGLRTNGGTGAVRLYVVRAGAEPSESVMTTNTNAATVGDQAYYRLTTSSADIALELDVVRGDNVFWLAIRCEEDTGRARQTFTGTGLAGIYGGRLPGLNIVPTGSALGMFVEVAGNSTDHAAGSFDRFTSPAEISGSPVVFEPSLQEWNESFVAPDAVGYVEVGFTTVLYVDSISIDGTGSLTLEDRNFGPAFRYDQFLSAAFAGQAVQEAMIAHTARLPIVALGDGLFGDNETEELSAYNVLRRYALLSASTDPAGYRTLTTIGLGAAAATPNIDWQDIAPGRSYQFEVRCMAILVLTTIGGAEFPTELEYVARIVDASGAALATGDPVTITQNGYTGTRTAAALQALLSTGGIVGNSLSGLEGMSMRSGLGVFTPITLTVQATGNLDVAPVQRLQIRARATDPATSAFIVIGPASVRMVEL